MNTIPRKCSVEGCEREIKTRDWCEVHYQRVWRTGEPQSEKRIKEHHSMTGSIEHEIWMGLRQRCYNKNLPSYKNYGGRGIGMCDRWSNSFLAFYEDMGVRPSPKHSVERIDNNGNYEPDNCKWATSKEQLNNTRRNINITAYGKTLTLKQWSELLNISYPTMNARYHRGLSPEQILDSGKLGVDGVPLKTITINGETKTFKEWTDISGLSYDTLNRRLQLDWPNDQLLNPNISRDCFITINGVARQLHEWAEMSGLPRATIRGRIDLGWPEDRLLIPPLIKRKKKSKPR